MKKKSVVAVVLIVVVAIVAVLVHRNAVAKEAPAYRFATVERGDVAESVSATGTLSAVTTVAVGTQVSGQVADVLVDFNDTVKKGQLLARIDPKLQEQGVTDAQANLAKARAQLLQAQRDNNRTSELMDAGLVARSEFETTDSSLDVARANVTSAQVALERARQNLEYTNIYAPIDGVVVERNVDRGQTVAASLSAPQLFLIAEDLTNMQILASVGEGDIASIKEGQKSEFTVQALTRQKFEGIVKQVRLQSKTNENVVNYTVVVSVENPKKQLLPGMTARVEFLTDAAEGVLKVSNAALRFGERNTLSTLDANGQIKTVKVRTGVSDGKFTEVRGAEVKEGMKVIAGTAQPQAATTDSAASPFQQGGTQQRAPRGGF
ncbi:MAG TPA: efflux RND transporter periplasmic adaptor subunit [Thermoanaerobaculia bacterium]|nr:efflux RND transporter periplasmic adaptor subunit [Thermoanaerobaculia bacterium]